MKDYYSSKDYLEKLDKYFRASNYLSAAQMYMQNNPLLRDELKLEDIKSHPLGHWGTCAGQNFVYAHCNRVIKKYDQDMILLSGPGHGGNFFLANSYLEGYYSEIYKDVSEDKKGMTKFCKQFSFAGGVPSHVAPETPGSINEGGELGYSLAHGFGAVLDNPNLIATVIVGDGEAETGPLATSWHSNKFINPARDGAVLPVLHLNGYKISNPTILSRIPKAELESLFVGYGYKPYFVEGSDPIKMHTIMAKTMDTCIEEIKKIQENARRGNGVRPAWPMIILRTPKGWTGPKQIDGQKIEDYFKAHQVPISMEKPHHVELLKQWLLSYKPDELFDENYRLKAEIAEILPKGDKRISASPYANGGKLLKEIITPNLSDFAVKVDTKNRGSVEAKDMLELSGYIAKLFELNKDNHNYRIFSPDEAMSNRLYKVFDTETRIFGGEIKDTDEKLSLSGRVMDSLLSEHACEGWLEGYLLTGRHGMFDSYEAFLRVVDSMVSQHAKWLKVTSNLKWRKPISSLNLVLTSHVWQQDHNGYTHQDPGFLTHLAEKAPTVTHMYLPVDANTLIATFDKMTKSKNCVNAVTASKHTSSQWLTMTEAKKLAKEGIGVWDWACTGDKDNPDIILACAGDTPCKEALAAISLVKKYLPDLSVRFVNVLSLMTLAPNTEHPDGLSDEQFDEIFTTNKPVIFSFHGYAGLIKQLVYNRTNKNFKVFGYKEEGTITTSFDMRVKNEIDRWHILMQIANNVKLPSTTKNKIIKEMEANLAKHKQYIAEYGVDLPEIMNWQWKEK